MIELLEAMPSSSEQILHYEKYISRDEPSVLDLVKIRKVLNKNWKIFYSNILGEYDLLKLFMINEQTKSRAEKIADGWGGCRFEAYQANETIAIVGVSIWDSPEDAEEFLEGFMTVLGSFRLQGDFSVVQKNKYVNFVIGVSNEKTRTTIIDALN